MPLVKVSSDAALNTRAMEIHFVTSRHSMVYTRTLLELVSVQKKCYCMYNVKPEALQTPLHPNTSHIYIDRSMHILHTEYLITQISPKEHET